MARDTTDETALTGVEELAIYLAGGNKPKDAWRIGTEHEKFPFYTADNSPVPYAGPRGIKAILEGMQAMLGWEPIMDEGNIIGLVEPTGQGAISLEPGGQFELSGAPLTTIHQTCREMNAHLSQVREIAEPLGIRFLGVGGSPKWTLAETPVMPKSRYKIMTNYMPKVGKEGLDMMYRTSTIQVNLDFSSERDMRRKMQVSMKLQSVATALFSSSPFTEGKPNGLLSWRSNIWRDTDNQRAGVLPFVFSENFGFADYVDWALDIPMYFILRDGRYHDCTHVTFRQFMNGALKGEVSDPVPNMGDWTNHLSTLFPEVRLKRFLEMRGADGGPWRRICALPAYWVGLLYDEEALTAAEMLTKDWTYEEVLALRNEVPTKALTATFRGKPLEGIARETLKISRLGLKNRNKLNSDGFDETHFLAPLEEIVAAGITDAERMLKAYNSIWAGSVEPIFLEYAY
ncbi:glutamate--cysteine ligase [Ochrobactrum soli]|uniref:Glutamate--cysteine ligase n=1 Tax=Ochrobactrum soli TaxID=2448455 RepID=A0A2P9HJP5_9HYPH|nr:MULTISPECIES: glutamate--cysteine ligase [Brucella]RRD23993.1 glutamate--cysteine ligase [Brucellaceae bacterium VT-16-1752]WHT43701.1 glutamate--cysteine ligase [Ochrobactrum sp. SSR]MDX4073717.1 glutamate--cysteine ligase [Brucella sp. NBRC 113783]RLL72557.1 glutamate--cysteine ligase [[Ochrobactrum] soli]WHS33604.1 glutamate--cysteine ligase [Brucella sp. NM4]